MFAGQVPVYFAIGGFGAVLFRRRLREYTLLVFPMSFLLLKLPTLASNLYREYHVCIFVMALLAAYALHVLFRYTVDRFVANRAFRAVCMCLVLGWMLKAPPRSRMPQPWIVWCGIMADRSQRGFRGLALMVLFMVTCYLRPSEALGLKHGDFIPPARGICQHWSLFLHRAQHGLTSKTGTVDDSIVLDSPQVQP